MGYSESEDEYNTVADAFTDHDIFLSRLRELSKIEQRVLMLFLSKRRHTRKYMADKLDMPWKKIIKIKSRAIVKLAAKILVAGPID